MYKALHDEIEHNKRLREIDESNGSRHSYKSSVENIGKVVRQILHFSNGNKRTIDGILTNTIKQGEFTKFMLEDGRMILVNTSNIDMIEVFDDTN